ncbi:MAG: glutamate--tRNA ligase [Patescibacteria group bacterium]
MSIFKKTVRVRFAPSPTGFLHIGGLRTALYNYLFARHNKGKFILRIEDTDRERFVEGGIENIINTLKNTGLDYDEGPLKGGKFGPYIQSERLDIYKKYVQELLNKGAAYHCFCTPAELEAEREDQKKNGLATKYSGRCLGLDKKSVQAKLKSGAPYVVRLKVPEEGTTFFDDLIYGKIEVENKNIDHQVLLKSDGFPTYHLANIVDDYLMKITNVIRGEEWLPSTPKHILLYKAFGWEPPKFAHLPLILNPDKTKLSKRQGDVAVEDYLRKGYLPETLINFIALLGWNPKGDQEIYSLKELIELFDIKSINKAGAVLNQEKLYWMNGEYIRKRSLSDITKLCIPYFIEAELIIKKGDKNYIVKETGEKINEEFIEKIISLEHERLKRLDEIPQIAAFLFKDKLDYEGNDLIWKKASSEKTAENLKILADFLNSIKEKDFNKNKLEELIKEWLAAKEIGTGDMLWPMRVALSGQRTSPSPFEIAEVLGKEKTIKRIKEAVKKLS